METVDTDYMQQTSLSDIDLSTQLTEVLSGIISKLDVYDVIDDGLNFSVINLKNDTLVYENISLRMVANIIAAAFNTGDTISHSAIEKLIQNEHRAVSKMVEINLYEELIELADTLDKETLYEIKLQEAEIKCRSAIQKVLLHAQQIITS